MENSWWLNRTMCDVLEEMRGMDRTKNYAPLLALVEELQIMGNKMEAAINDINDIEEMTKKRSRLKKEIKKLRQDKQELKGEEDDE